MLAAMATSGCGARSEPRPRAPAPPRATVEPANDERATSIDPCGVEIEQLPTVDPELDAFARRNLDLECVVGPRGAWRLVFTELHESPLTDPDESHGATSVDGSWALAWTDLGGTSIIGAPRPFHVDDSNNWEATRVRVAERFDYDSDGIDELAISIEELAFEARREGHVEVVTVHEGVIVTYPPSETTSRVDSIEDINGDGRPDLVSTAPYLLWSPFGIDGELVGGPPHVYRSLPDGSFSDSDPVVIAALSEACPGVSLVLLRVGTSTRDSYDAGGRAVSCARIWGVSPEDIVAQLRDELPRACRSDPDYPCSALLSTLAEHARRLDPPQQLR